MDYESIPFFILGIGTGIISYCCFCFHGNEKMHAEYEDELRGHFKEEHSDLPKIDRLSWSWVVTQERIKDANSNGIMFGIASIITLGIAFASAFVGFPK